MRTGTVILIIIILIIVGGVAYLAFGGAPGAAEGPSSSDAAAASSTLVAFGAELQQVSLLAPDASSTIAADYAPYVAPDLLAAWEADPSSAPGRVVSSPWPDHLEVAALTPSAGGFTAEGAVVYLTSTGSAGSDPFTATLEPYNGSWLISAFQESSSTAAAPMIPAGSPAPSY